MFHPIACHSSISTVNNLFSISFSFSHAALHLHYTACCGFCACEFMHHCNGFLCNVSNEITCTVKCFFLFASLAITAPDQCTTILFFSFLSFFLSTFFYTFFFLSLSSDSIRFVNSLSLCVIRNDNCCISQFSLAHFIATDHKRSKVNVI